VRSNILLRSFCSTAILSSLLLLSACNGQKDTTDSPSTDQTTGTTTTEAPTYPSPTDAPTTPVEALDLTKATPSALVDAGTLPPVAETGGTSESLPPTAITATIATPSATLPPGANLLDQARSPELRRVATSGIHWMEWGPAAFERAKAGDRPILVFIGSNWCEYCHLMDATTFTNEEVVKLLNDNFVSIRVDRDERPDLDERFQSAYYHFNQNQGGGWPLTVFCLPDGRPFDALTFVHAKTEGDRIGLIDLLKQSLTVLRERRSDAEALAAGVMEKMKTGIPTAPPSDASVNADVLKSLTKSISDKFDEKNGGFGPPDQAHFPNGTALLFLLQMNSDTGNQELLAHVNKSLLAYFKGGLRDNVHGGYYRYTADGEYAQPRFEKMLFVQAELLSAFSQAYAATNRSLFKEAGQGILRFMRDTLEDPEGGFYASMDSDTDPKSGNTYHTWTPDEVRKAAEGRPGDVFVRYFHIGAEGNVDADGRSVPRALGSLKETADALNINYSDAQDALDTARKKLGEARTAKGVDIPHVDKTILTPWNALMITAYIDSYRYLGDTEARDFALKSADFILKNMVSEQEGIAHSFILGKASVFGLLDPQVQMANALLDCFEVTGNQAYLENALSIMQFAEGRFLDEKLGLYRDRLPDTGTGPMLEVPRYPLYDVMSPSPNATAAVVWYRLYQATGDEKALEISRRIATAATSQPGMGGAAAGTLARAVALLINGPPKINLVGKEDDQTIDSMREAALPVYRLGKMVNTVPLDQAKKSDTPPDDKGDALAYICVGSNCAPPVKKSDEIAPLAKSFGKTSD